MTEQVTPQVEPLQTTVAGKRHHTTGKAAGIYDGSELKPYEGRPNAMDAFELPSILNGQRVWRKSTDVGATPRNL